MISLARRIVRASPQENIKVTASSARKTPSAGGKPDKLIRDALMIELKREATDDDGKRTINLNIVARKLVSAGKNGDIQAIKEIADRVDGRPAQAVEGNFTGSLSIAWEK